MHEVSLGGTLVDYLTGESRECTTYEDLRQALARFLVEERGYDRARLRPRFEIRYEAGGEEHSREADIAVFTASGGPALLLLFCPGQIQTYAREALAMARLALPAPCPLVGVTDMRDAELLAAGSGDILAKGLGVLPRPDELAALALANALPLPDAGQRDREGRILHAYTGFLKTCCGESCILPE